MRYGCAALLMLISSAVAASAQEQVRVTAPAPRRDVVDTIRQFANQKAGSAGESRRSGCPSDVV